MLARRFAFVSWPLLAVVPMTLARAAAPPSRDPSPVVRPGAGPSALSLAPVGTWSSEGNQASAGFQNVASAGDVNGDGFGDLVVGAPWYDGAMADQGQVFLFLGSEAGLATGASATLVSRFPYLSFGQALAGVGDVNGDGYDDVLVASPNNGLGWVELFAGGPAGLAATPSWYANSPYGVAGFGWSVDGAGDVNGDGYDDVVVGTRWGEAYVYHGATSGMSSAVRWRGTGAQANYYGEAVAGAGDVNGDGYDDVIVGARGYENGEATEGAAFLYAGSASGVSPTASWMAEGNALWAWLGRSVAGAGDVDGDGYDDVVVGAQQYGYGGGAFVFRGSPTGLAPSASWIVHSVPATWNLGASVAGGGDVDGDGRADVLVGSDGRSLGAALLYTGGPAGLGTPEAWRGADGQSDSRYGWSVALADVTGDGRAEVVVGDPLFDDGEPDEGRVTLYQFPPGSPRPRLSVADVVVDEGDSGETQAVFKVSLSAPTVADTRVRYATADATALAGADYSPRSGWLTIPAGATETTVSIPVLGDTVVESAETFQLRLWDPANATVLRGTSTATIANDDLPVLSVYPREVDEDHGGAWFTLVTLGLSPAADKPVTVEFETRDGTAVAGADYLASTVRMGLQPGYTSTNVFVGIVGDHVSEPDETFEVVLRNPQNARLGQDTATVTIRNDDAPGISVEDVRVAEGPAGDVQAVFTVSLSPASSSPVSVNWTTADGTAGAPGDYQAASGTVSLAPQTTTATIAVTVHPDAEKEVPETFSIVLANASGASLVRAQAVATIVDPGYFTVEPCRVVDTRAGNPPALIAGADRRFLVAERCGIPRDARAVSINLTVTEPTAPGHLTVYPGGDPLPLASVLNYGVGQTRANNAVVRLGGVGELTVRCGQGSGTTHFVLDVTGYFQ